jgi:hypothetical protein
MSTPLGPDWKALAAAQKIEINDTQKERLEALAKTMLGLRGMIDWTEQPAISFRVDPIEDGSK